MKHELTITTPTDRDLVMTRVFDAPRHLVYQAISKPEFIKRWLGNMPGWTFPVCDVDLRVGGKYRYVWRGPNGEEMGMGGVYQEIVPNERIVATEKYDAAWYPGDATASFILAEKNGQTTLTLSVRYASKEVRDAVAKGPATEGVGAGFDALEALLAGMLATTRT